MSRKYKTIRLVVECEMQDLGDEEERQPWSSPPCKDRAKDTVWKAIHEYAANHKMDGSRPYPVYGDDEGRTYADINGQKFYEPKIG